MRASSARASDVQAEVDKVEKPTQSSDPEAYPFGVGRASVRNIPIALLIEDNVALDYLLSFARKEFSSEPVELLAAHREMNRERTRTSFAPDPLHVRSMLAELLEAHVAENAPMQVTLPGTAVSVLRTWLGEYSALAPKEKAASSAHGGGGERHRAVPGKLSRLLACVPVHWTHISAPNPVPWPISGSTGPTDLKYPLPCSVLGRDGPTGS